MTYGSLFSGAGGADLGFHQAGFECLWTAEIDRLSSDVLAKLGAKNLGDVTKIDASIIEVPDVVVWGSPCQSFSIANKKRVGLEGESGLFYDGINIIRQLARRGLGLSIWENVAGTFSANNGNDFRRVLQAFLQCGAVDIGWRVLDAKYFGVPQPRRRIFVIADFRGKRVGEILRYAEASSSCVAKGKNNELENTGGKVSATVTSRHSLQARGIHGCLLVRGPAQEMPPQYIITNDNRLRWRTPLESDRLMGWPDDWTRFGASGKGMSDAARYRMTGNGIVAPVARWLAEGVKMALNHDIEEVA